MPAIAPKMPLLRDKPTRQGTRSRRPRGERPHQGHRSASARLPRRRMHYAALPGQQVLSGPSAIKAGSGFRLKPSTSTQARRKRLKTRAHAGGAR
jgi:hypothetical protein